VEQPASGSGGRDPAPGEPTTARVQGIFSRIAGTYDLVNVVASFGIDRTWRRRAVRTAALAPDSRVLDLAAGTGDLTMALARRGEPAEVVSTDFVPEMLEVAEGKAEGYEGPTRIVFEAADAQDLRYEDGSFDVVTIAFGMRNLPDRAANMREVHRVLKPGGRYVVLEFSHPKSAVVRALYGAYLGHVVPFLGGVIARDRASYLYLRDSIRGFPVQEDLAAELEAAGFSRVSWQDLTFGVVTVHVCEK
jgi:demethylmenaquinone methyltransferase/2-methoxy-6-polyprenyl-1,4-benzoquinol methylase